MRSLTPALVALCITSLSACQAGLEGASTRDETGTGTDEATFDAETRPPRTREGLRLNFDGGASELWEERKRFRTSGTSWLGVQSVTTGSGAVRRSKGATSGWSVTLPAYSATGGDYAVIMVSENLTRNVFSPDTTAFTFGADFALDAVSTGVSSDNGDSLIQRGLFEDSGQYKIEIDGKRPSCRVMGTDGAVIATAAVEVVPERWYRVQCTRRDETVSLELGRILADGSATMSSVSSSGPIGEISLPTGTPLSIGGKLQADGSPVLSSTDQFNGEVDSVFYRRVE